MTGNWADSRVFWQDKRVIVTGFTGEIRWDTTKPNGQPRRKLDTSRAQALFGFEAKRPFAEGLRETVDWYEMVNG